MGFWFKGNKIKALPAVVEEEPVIHSININGQQFVSYEDTISFMMKKYVDNEIRWAFDAALRYTRISPEGE